MKISLSRIIPVVLMTAITCFDGFSLPSGITGRTLKPGSVPGCAMKSCHAGDEKASVTIKAPALLRNNEVARCTVLVVGSKTGINISVSDGILVPVSRLLSVNGELTHPSAGSGVYVFDYTAPPTPGTQTLYATGLSGGISGPWNFASSKLIYVDVVAAAGESPHPRGFSLGQNFPNPFNPSTQIQFSLVERGRTSLKIYNLLGDVVAVLVDEWMSPGQHTVSWNANGFPSGVYVYKLESGGATETKRLILLR